MTQQKKEKKKRKSRKQEYRYQVVLRAVIPSECIRSYH